MSKSKTPHSDRREFLTHVATAAAVVAGTACVAPLSAAGLHATPVAGSGLSAPFDDSWTRRVVTAKRKAVFDSPNIDEGLALSHATFFVQGYREQLGMSESDIVPVVVMRHFGTVMAMNDALWERYTLGERYNVKDPATGKPAVRNPFLRVAKDDTNALVSPEASLEGLLRSGAVLLACNKAAMKYAGQFAQQVNRDPEEVRAEVRAGIVPGVLLQPSGVYASIRAQEVGCSYIRST